MNHDIELIKSLITQGISDKEASNEERFAGGRHVYVVYSDGELCSTKAGCLLWQRTLHLLESGIESRKVNAELFPYRMNGYGMMYTQSDRVAYDIHNAITGNNKKPFGSS